MRIPSASIICDVHDCDESFDTLGTIRDALGEAREVGWRQRVVKGKRWDTCPDHSAARFDVATKLGHVGLVRIAG